MWPVTRAGKIELLVPTEDRENNLFCFSSVLSNRLLLNIITMQFAVTGPGKLTVGKLYGGILIYEIWKTTRFSNLEILAKVTTITKCICIASTSSS